MEETIIKKRRGFSKQVSPEEAINEMKELRQRLSFLEKNVTIREKKSWINISKEVTFRPDVYHGKIKSFSIFHHCWCVGMLYWKNFPDFRTGSKHYKIEWVQEDIRILWDGQGR